MTRNVVVTGGASGIGAATARLFASRGDTVTVMDLSPTSEHPFIEVDLTSTDSIDRAVQQLDFPVDVLCNIAGVAGTAPVQTVMAVNFLGLRELTGAVVPRMPDGGCVVNLASTAGWYWRDSLGPLKDLLSLATFVDGLEWAAAHLPTGYDAYVRSKQAVVVWTTLAAQEHLGRIRVNSVSPGPVETPLLASFYASMGNAELDPLTARAGGRNGTADEIANVIAFLASAEASWINGTDIVTDGGAEMAEALAAAGVLEPLATSSSATS